MKKEKIILELFELEELIKLEKDDKELKKLKERYRVLNNKLEKEIK